MLQASRPWRRCRLRTSCWYTNGSRARVIFAARAEQSSPTTTMAVCGELPSSTSCHVINLLVRVQTCARVLVVVCGYRRGETGWVEGLSGRLGQTRFIFDSWQAPAGDFFLMSTASVLQFLQFFVSFRRKSTKNQRKSTKALPLHKKARFR